MPFNFNKYAQKGNEFLNELSEALGKKRGSSETHRILSATLKALRDRLTLTENFQLLAQLPMALKAGYIEGWVPTRTQDRIKKKFHFTESMLRYKDSALLPRAEDFSSAVEDIRAVLRTLKKHVSEGEFQDIEAILPRELKDLLHESVNGRNVSLKFVHKTRNKK